LSHIVIDLTTVNHYCDTKFKKTQFCCFYYMQRYAVSFVLKGISICVARTYL